MILVDMMDRVCGTCGCPYAVPERLARQAEELGEPCLCPNGHAWRWPEGGRSLKALEAELRAAEERAGKLEEALDAANRSIAVLNRREAEAGTAEAGFVTLRRPAPAVVALPRWAVVVLEDSPACTALTTLDGMGGSGTTAAIAKAAELPVHLVRSVLGRLERRGVVARTKSDGWLLQS